MNTVISVIKCVSVSGWSRTFSGTETRLYFAETIVSAATLYSQTRTAPRTLLASTLQNLREKMYPRSWDGDTPLRTVSWYYYCDKTTKKLPKMHYSEKYHDTVRSAWLWNEKVALTFQAALITLCSRAIASYTVPVYIRPTSDVAGEK